jgi:type I site-specific restriction endonuclease
LVDLRFKRAQKQKDKESKEQSASSLSESITKALNSKVEEMNDEKMAELMKLFQQWEGNENVEKLRDKSKSVEEKLIENNPDLYKKTVIDALLERMKEYNLNPDDLSEETKQLVSGEIIQVSEIKEVKERALREIAEKGAKSK